MDSLDLRYFEAVARLGAMNRAAEELNTVQSNVTARVRSLEAELGVQLFRRHSRGVELTHAGRRLLPFAVKSARLLSDARRAALEEGPPQGPLNLGSLETTAALRLSPLLSRFGRLFPKVDISLRVAPNDELVRRVLAQELDGAFICGPVEEPDLLARRMFAEELVVAMAADAPMDRVLSSGCKVLVKGPGCAYRDRLDKLLALHGVREVTRLEFGTLDAIIACLEGGLGITLLPRALLQATADAGKVRLASVPPEIGRVETLFIRRRDAVEFSAMSAFMDVLAAASDEGGARRSAA